MARIGFLLPTGMLVAALGSVSLGSAPANAVVYCRTVGVPHGCVVRHPVARRMAVTPGVGAAGVGIRRGTPMNRGGPVNRVGRR